MKCLVRYCPNRQGEGRFEGPICRPCAKALRGEPAPFAASRILAAIWPSPSHKRLDLIDWHADDPCHRCCPQDFIGCTCNEFCQCLHI